MKVSTNYYIPRPPELGEGEPFCITFNSSRDELTKISLSNDCHWEISLELEKYKNHDCLPYFLFNEEYVQSICNQYLKFNSFDSYKSKLYFESQFNGDNTFCVEDIVIAIIKRYMKVGDLFTKKIIMFYFIELKLYTILKYSTFDTILNKILKNKTGINWSFEGIMPGVIVTPTSRLTLGGTKVYKLLKKLTFKRR